MKARKKSGATIAELNARLVEVENAIIEQDDILDGLEARLHKATSGQTPLEQAFADLRRCHEAKAAAAIPDPAHDAMAARLAKLEAAEECRISGHEWGCAVVWPEFRGISACRTCETCKESEARTFTGWGAMRDLEAFLKSE